MIGTLLSKDLQRSRRNPWPVLINLALPVLITAVMGLAFGKSGSSGGGMGKIKIAVVDEDENALGGFLKSFFSQGESQDFFAPEFISRDDAMARIKSNELSAVFVIPKGFSEAYLDGQSIPPLELVKNPAQRFHPAIVEEFLGIATEGLNIISRNLGDEIPMVVELVETEGFPDLVGLAGVMVKLGTKFKKAENYLFPPLITFSENTEAEKDESEASGFNMFAFLLPMLSSVFLIYLADGAVRDIYAEINGKTLARIKSVRNQLFPVVASKAALAVVVGMIGGVVWFAGSTLLFDINWKTPFRLALLITAYSVCAAGFMALLVGLFRTEKRAETFSSIVILGIAFLGGSFITVDAMPDFIQNHISPWMPNYWFIQSVQSLQFDRETANWGFEAVKMLVLGTIFLCLGTAWIRRNVEGGNAS